MRGRTRSCSRASSPHPLRLPSLFVAVGRKINDRDVSFARVPTLYHCMKPPTRRAAALRSLVRGGGAFMRLSVAAITMCLALVGISAAQHAAAAMTRRPTNIPAQPLGSALEALAKERDLQVIYRSDLVGSVQSAGAVGVFTPQEALGKILAGTGLTYRYLNDTTVTIAKVS